jgi:hypothetical protein
MRLQYQMKYITVGSSPTVERSDLSTALWLGGDGCMGCEIGD